MARADVPAAGRLPEDDEPLEADNVKVAIVGTVLWALGFLALLPFYRRLADDGRAWIVWTCLPGFGLGLLGIAYSRRRGSRPG